MEQTDVVVVGSGFGGSVTAQRLAAGGLQVVLLERGKAYPPGSFPRSPYEMQRNFWDPSEGLHGLFDVWSFRGTEAVVSSGLGGGSLIYANVLLRKDERWFVHHEPLPGGGYEHWPISRADLEPHYDAVEAALGATRYPVDVEPYASTPKTVAMREAAQARGLDLQLPPLAVAFGNPGEPPVPGEPLREGAYPNLHGRTRRSCVLCGECDIGCNAGSKNTLDHTYLSAAKHAGADLRTRAEVRRIVPLDSGGYAVHWVQHEPAAEGRPTRTADLPEHELRAARVVLAAGALGTPYLLLRNRSALTGLSRALGTRFSGNGDLLTFVLGARTADGKPRRLEGSRGPVITSAVRVPDAADGGRGRGFYVQDAGYPGFAEWMVEAASAPSTARRAARFLAHRVRARLTRSGDTGLGSELQGLLGDAALSAGSLPLLGMGRDVPDGVMRLRRGRLAVDWDTRTSESYFARVREVMAELADELGGELKDNPLWHLGQRVVTVHALGGAPMGRSSEEGVVDQWGEVFGHPGLYVADGAALPGPVGANPSLTIAAFADRLCDRLLETWTAASRPVVPQRTAEQAPDAVVGLPEQPRADVTHVEFTEEMKGHVTLGEADCRRGAERGRTAGTDLMFHLRIVVEDVESFVHDPQREGSATGWVDSDLLGGRCPVERGWFNLFVHEGDATRSRMLYRLLLRDGAGNPITLSGHKDVHDDAGLDVWKDTSTLYVQLHRGHHPPGGQVAERDLVGSGVLTIHVPDFLRQLTTFRAGGPEPGDGARALATFGRVFLGELWSTYGPALAKDADSTSGQRS